jgi:squalene-hopene/tetraprenyl-beta-curcumene cyclase
VECYFALKLAGISPDKAAMKKAREFILSKGGVPKTRTFTKIWLSLFGQWEWEGTPVMPPELIFLPSWFPFNIYEFSSWARATIVPMLVILTERPSRPIPTWAAIDELYPTPREHTEYSLPGPKGLIGWERFFHSADKLLRLYQRMPIKPGRGKAVRKATQWIISHQEADGSWGGIQPPWVYSLIALNHLGYDMDHPVMKKGFEGFEGFAIEEGDTWRVQACVSPVWDTCLAVIGLLDSGMSPHAPAIQKATRWMLKEQILTGGDWQVKNKKAPPGGWAFEFENDIYPDLDDVAEVIMALDGARLDGEDEERKARAIERGVEWLLSMQSKGGGWAAFDKDNDKAYIAKIPFGDFGEALDPPSVDVTAHVVEMLGKLGYRKDFPPIERAYRYMRAEQEREGPWFGRWGVNYIYGTGAVLPALEAIGEDMDQPYIRQALDWLVAHQNRDGGWGESCGSYVDSFLRGVGPSTPSQTAWALLALLAAGETDSPPIRRGLQYLADTQQEDGSWDEPYFTGTGFPGYGVGQRLKRPTSPGERGHQGLEMPAGFMINYHMYRNYWPLMALGRYQKLARQGEAAADAQARGLQESVPLHYVSCEAATDGHGKGPENLRDKRDAMKTQVYCIKVESEKAPEFIDITHRVRECVAESKVMHGFAVVYSRHTTAAIKINENEPLLLEDMEKFLERISPRNGSYRHNDFTIRTVNMNEDECPNGHAHCQHLLLGTSETIPIVEGIMQFGRWQSIFLIELDHARPREVVVQVLGE